jgi:hypothetical protein
MEEPMKHLFLLTFLGSVALLRADSTPGVLVWTEASDNPNGITVNTSCFESGTGCGSDSFADVTFSVTSAGEFALATFLSVSFMGYNCGTSTLGDDCSYDFGPNDALAAGIAEANSEILNTPFYNASLNASPMSATYCGLPPQGCFGTASAYQYDYQVFNLGTGNYTLELDYFFVADGGYNPSGYGTFTSLLVPYPTTLFVTPEPKGDIAMVASALLLLPWLKRKMCACQ